MNSSNRFRLKEALLAILAGDIFRGTPVGARLMAFKALYYLMSVFNPRACFSAWLRRKQVIREATAETSA
jgi:hypothetical protein